LEAPSVLLQGGGAPIIVRLFLAQMHDVDRTTLAAYQSWFSEEEHQRYAAFLHERRRCEFIVGRGLARRALADELKCSPREIQFEVVQQGQLALCAPAASEGLHFNITHTADYVGCAICRGYAVGVDVEKLDQRVSVLEIANRFFSAAESSVVGALSEAERFDTFFTIWTIKEALAKAHGLGLAAPLESSRIRVSAQSGIEALTTYPPFSAGAWLACCSPTPQHRLAICVLCEESHAVVISPQAPENSGDVSAAGLAWTTGWLRNE
jgi:4'-phosphopantetheinyl transferase